jgi:hypothetical protein
MIHTDRVFGVMAIPDIKTLTRKMYHWRYNSCEGYQQGKHLFLNDSSSPAGDQEFAVFRVSDGKFIQIGTMTIPDRSFTENHLKNLLVEAKKSKKMLKTYTLQIEDAAEHQCHLCK